MSPAELFLSDGKPAAVFFCGECKVVHQSKALAERCCDYKCNDCGVPTPKYYTTCGKCQAARNRKREQDRFERAEKLLTWDGMVFVVGIGKEFHESVGEMLEYLDDEGLELPEYVWACKPNYYAKAYTTSIVDQIADASCIEDWSDEILGGLDELEAAIQKFNETNSRVCSYSPDYTKAVLLEKGGQ